MVDISKAIDPNLFSWPSSSPVLFGARCLQCGSVSFPAGASCMRCGSEEVERIELPRRGRLWAWTVQHFMPKSPYHSSETEGTFQPFGVGYVELPGAVRIETRLTEANPARLKIGAELELVVYEHRIEADGTRIMNYAFSPVGGAS